MKAVKLFPTVLGLSKEDHEKLAAKKPGPRLQEVRDTLEVIQRTATNFAKEMYLITLRTMLNEAIHLKIIKKQGCYPFGKRQSMIPGSNNTKKAFDQSVIERIYYYECDPKRQSMHKARSFWFFMYFGQGMNPKEG